jgi:hypothetical protein
MPEQVCFSFNSADNRAKFLRDEQAYCAKFGLTPQQCQAVAHRNVSEMIAAGNDLPAWLAGYWSQCGTSGAEPASVQDFKSCKQQEGEPWQGSSAVSAQRTFPRRQRDCQDCSAILLVTR